MPFPGTQSSDAGGPEIPHSIVLPLPKSDADLPVDGNDPEGEHAGRADQQVEESREVAPDHAKDPFPPDGAGHHEGQHQHGEQEVGQGQAEDELVAEGKEVGLLVQGDDNDQVAQADEDGDDDDGDELGHNTPFTTLGGGGSSGSEVAQLLPAVEGGVEAHGQCTPGCGEQSMLDSCGEKAGAGMGKTRQIPSPALYERASRGLAGLSPGPHVDQLLGVS